MKRPKLLISLIFGVILVLSVVRVSIEGNISTTGIELVRLSEEVEKYRKENMLLQEKYLVESSFTQIASKAAVIGFVDGKNTLNLTTPLSLALRQ
jgi:cell division protein FtsL